jgi:hypothetical protein
MNASSPVFLFLRRSETLFDNLPVDDIPNRIDIIGSNIAIIYIICMFPNINALRRVDDDKTRKCSQTREVQNIL